MVLKFKNMKIFKKNQKIYAKTKEVFGNPLMGYAPCAWNESVREDVTLLYMDITWAELEPVEGKFAWNATDGGVNPRPPGHPGADRWRPRTRRWLDRPGAR